MAEYIGSIIAFLVLLAAAGLAVKEVRARLSGKRSGGCANCAMSGSCDKRTATKR